jgi:hypothetical protein
MPDPRNSETSGTSPITGLRVTEVSVATRGALRHKRRSASGLPWSATSLWMGIASLALAPAFGIGVIPAILSIVVGHIAKHREPQGIPRSRVGLALSYVALVVGTAVLVFVALPIVFAFLVSAGYILAD